MLSLLWRVNLFKVCKLVFIKLSLIDLIPMKFDTFSSNSYQHRNFYNILMARQK